MKWTEKEREILVKIGVSFDIDGSMTDEQIEDMYELVCDVLGTGSFGYALDGTPDPDTRIAENIISKLTPVMRSKGLFTA